MGDLSLFVVIIVVVFVSDGLFLCTFPLKVLWPVVSSFLSLGTFYSNFLLYLIIMYWRGRMTKLSQVLRYWIYLWLPKGHDSFTSIVRVFLFHWSQMSCLCLFVFVLSFLDLLTSPGEHLSRFMLFIHDVWCSLLSW